MSLRDIQTSIAQWGRETFGHGDKPPPADAIAARMNVEVAELLNGLAALQFASPEARAELIRELQLECADVGIMLVQVADALGGDLQDLIAYKMEVNRARSWGRTSSGKVQHVEPVLFKEEGSGHMMDPAKWYILYDAGGVVTPEGFETADAALAWAKANGHPEAVEPRWIGWKEGWADPDGINVMFGEHLRLWWLENGSDKE